MPWTANDAYGHTHKADTKHKQEIWASVANKARDEGLPDENAIRIANHVIEKHHSKRRI